MPVSIKTAVPPAVAPATPPVAPVNPDQGYRYVELALYNRYMRQGTLFERGTPTAPKIYKVTNEQAVVLLGEQDAGRAIFRIYRKPKPVPTPMQKMESGIVDATSVALKATPVPEVMPDDTVSILEIGNDDEIADILEEIPVE